MSEDVKEAFKEWAQLGSDPYNITEIGRGVFHSGNTQNAWYGYQAATASSEAKWRGLVEKLVEMAGQAADDLESEINENYNGTLGYPVQKRRYDNDMSTVLCLRDVLTEAAKMLGGK